MILQVKKLNPRAKLPAKAYSTDAGFDLFFLHDIEGDTLVLRSNERVKIDTGISIKLPEGYCGVIKDRRNYYNGRI